MEKNNQKLIEYDYEASASSKPVNLKLIFSDDIPSPVFTKENITRKAGGNESIKVLLSKTQQKVTTGQIASAKVKIVLLRGDGVISTSLEFKNSIVVDWRKKKNILLGDLYVDLKNGCGAIGEIRIKHDRHPLRNVNFRLGAMVIDCSNYKVKEAITCPFEVKDRRNLPKVLGPLLLEDEVWRLKNISKNGKIHKRLVNNNILTVKAFLDMHVSNPLALEEIYGIKGKKWEMTISHAKTSLVETMCNGHEQVGSNLRQLNDVPSFNYDVSMDFDNNCYKPCENDLFDSMIVDSDFSTQDVDQLCDMWIHGFEPCEAYDGFEPCEAYDQEDGNNGESVLVHMIGGEGKYVKAKKRWIKLRTIWLSIVVFHKNVGSCVGAILGG